VKFESKPVTREDARRAVEKMLGQSEVIHANTLAEEVAKAEHIKETDLLLGINSLWRWFCALPPDEQAKIGVFEGKCGCGPPHGFSVAPADRDARCRGEKFPHDIQPRPRKTISSPRSDDTIPDCGSSHVGPGSGADGTKIEVPSHDEDEEEETDRDGDEQDDDEMYCDENRSYGILL